MRRVLMVSAHFPPDSSAGTHRARLLAPHLATYGWEPTVLTCEPSAYEGQLDPDLTALVHGEVRVVRAPAISARLTRRVGVGDLGLRSFGGLYRAASSLLGMERFDALFITIFPAYTALLGPLLVRRFGVPFVLDYQDPWVSAWGVEVGGGNGGRADWKSRSSRLLAEWLEPVAVRSASAVTAVSAGTYEPILSRNPLIRPITATIPIGAEPRDFSINRSSCAAPLPFDPDDGNVHVCSTGTILPLGIETLRAVLCAVALVRDRRQEVYRRLRLHFFGTSNQTAHTTELKVMPLAFRLGVADVVFEVPTRVPYSAIVRVQQHASILLAMGSSERHYTASKIFPLLLAGRPLLAVYHEASTVADVIERASRPRTVKLVRFSDQERAEAKVEEIYGHLLTLAERPAGPSDAGDLNGLHEFFAETLAGRLADVLNRVAERSAA